MPVIAFVSPKGGVGKTTAALLLATQLAAHTGQGVTMIDADPNLPLSRWSKIAPLPARLTVIADVGESTIVDTIADARESSGFVIVDLEGIASARVTNAVAMSDLAIIPIQASALDADQAARAVSLIRTTARAHGRAIPYRILFNRVAAASRIRTRNFKSIEASMAEAGIVALTTHLAEREAFKSIFIHGGTLDTLDSSIVTTIEAARTNARELAEEIITILRDVRDKVKS